MRISTRSPNFHSVPQRASAQSKASTVNESPIEQTLFGSIRPKPLDFSQFPQLAEQMRWLRKQKMKIAAFFGDHDSDYALVLAEGMNACIDQNGTIFIGEKLLQGDPSLLAGVLAHEIGHRPKTWKRMQQGNGLSRAELLAFAREEEAKADRAAGRALAALDLSPEPLCAFLREHGHFEKQPETYYPVQDRIDMITQAHAAQRTRKAAAKSLFPGFHQATDVKQLLSDERPAPGAKKKRRVIRSV